MTYYDVSIMIVMPFDGIMDRGVMLMASVWHEHRKFVCFPGNVMFRMDWFLGENLQEKPMISQGEKWEKPWVSCGFSHQFWGLNWVQKSQGCWRKLRLKLERLIWKLAPDDGQQFYCVHVSVKSQISRGMAVNWVPIWVPIWPWKLLRFDLWPHWNPMWTYDESRQKGKLPSSSMKDQLVHPPAMTIFRRWWVLRKPSKLTQNVPELDELGNVRGLFPIINRDHGKYMLSWHFFLKKSNPSNISTPRIHEFPLVQPWNSAL